MLFIKTHIILIIKYYALMTYKLVIILCKMCSKGIVNKEDFFVFFIPWVIKHHSIKISIIKVWPEFTVF
jgi:hypothetical protein